MPFISIKTKAIILLVLMTTIPIIAGGVGSAYYWGILEKHIRDDYLSHARALSVLTNNYMDSSKIYLESQAGGLSIISSVTERNLPILNYTLKNIQNTSQFNGIYVTDPSGIVISSYPYSGLTGVSEMDKPYVYGPIDDAKIYVSKPVLSEYTNNHTVYMGVPIQDESGEVLGALVGSLDLHNYSSFMSGWQADTGKYTYLVDNSGLVIAIYNEQNMDMMGKNISDYPGVREVSQGEEGVYEAYNPAVNQNQMVTFSPITNYGIGILIAIPVDVVYHPIQNAKDMMIAFVIVSILIAFTIAAIVGRYLVTSIINLSKATKEMPSGDYQKYLPKDRDDEIGELARSFDHMAKTIRADQQKIISARDAAEEEKNKTEFYLDLVSHDINNLNQVVIMSLELIANDNTLTEAERKSIERAIISARSSAEIIKNVRSVQRITMEQPPLETLDIDSMISDCISEAPRPINKKVVFNYAPRKGMLIKGIPLMKEIFCNMINNSIKYSRDEVEVDILVDSATKDGKKFYRITIADNGYGIPDEMKQKLFKRFQRGTTKTAGKGLGLYIVKTLTERFGGSVYIEDRVPGDYSKGAKFIVLLPAAQ